MMLEASGLAIPGRLFDVSLQIAAGARRLGHNWPVFHPVELIDASIRGADPRGRP